ncbi:SNARE-like domain protein [Acetobacteraceae bacterium AT-5844]|nr:SNARE-like domain protein [Acetobacteraceae bacterium AT-5844]
MEEYLLAPFLAWVESHQGWAALAVFLLAFLESLPFIGFFVPGSALLIGVGLLVATGALPALPVVLAGMIGAALGDSSGYFLARWLGPSLLRRHLPSRWRRPYGRAVLWFRRWGWWAVFISRFFAPLRAFIPVVAGFSQMTHGRFQSANLLSAVIWAPLVLSPSYVLSWFAELPRGLMHMTLAADWVPCTTPLLAPEEFRLNRLIDGSPLLKAGMI